MPLVCPKECCFERASYDTWNSSTFPGGTCAAKMRPGSSGTETCNVVPAAVPGGTRTSNNFCPFGECAWLFCDGINVGGGCSGGDGPDMAAYLESNGRGVYAI